MLFRKQRNELFDIVVNSNLLPTDFKEITSDSTAYEGVSNVYELRFTKDKRFYYQLIDSSDSFKPYFSPNSYNGSEDNKGIDGWHDWNNATRHFKRWIKILKEEFETPDLWAEAQANAKLFVLNPAAPNEMFSGSELRQLEGQVRQLVQGLVALGLPANAQKLLTEIVNEIPEKATRFTKKEIAGWFMGAFAAQVTNLALSQEHVSAIAHLIKTTFMGLLQLH
jgi:hypothetical protein